MVSSYIPDDCWESIFKFIIINDDDDYFNYKLRSLSLVSKQFLSITNRLLFSLTLNDESTCCRLFKRFTNLNSLNLTGNNYIDLDNLLIEISRFPLKQLTSLDLSNQPTIPAIGLRAFSKKITTLTSFTCSYIDSINTSDLFLIAECFPLLQELNFCYPCPSILEYGFPQDFSSYVDGIEALSLALIKLRKVNLSGFPINNESLFHLFNNCKLLQQVIMFDCDVITYTGLAYALRERPTLSSLSFSSLHSGVLDTLNFINSLVSLKGLTCLVLHDMNISDELLYSIARKGLPLTELDLSFCTGYSYTGILCLLSKCQRIEHLNLQGADYLTDQHVVQLSSFLGDLVSINLSYCEELTESTLFALARKCPSLSKIIMETVEKKILSISDSLVEIGVYPQLKSLLLGGNLWLSDESIIMFSSIFPNLNLFDLNSCTCYLNLKLVDIYSCTWLSEGNCDQDLRKRCGIRYLNLADYYSRMKLL